MPRLLLSFLAIVFLALVPIRAEEPAPVSTATTETTSTPGATSKSEASPTPATAHASKFNGKIAAIDLVQRILTITGRRGDKRTYKITDNTLFRINGTKVELAAIPIGAYARGTAKWALVPSEASEVCSVNILVQNKKDETGTSAQSESGKGETKKVTEDEPAKSDSTEAKMAKNAAAGDRGSDD